jgi:hypothetical protein
MTTKSEVRERVRQRIRSRLAELDREPVWLARVVGVDLSLVSRWLSGERPVSEEKLRDVALALHRPTEWFTAPHVETVAA